MLARPPDILITNYAMLEHLLLLPRNAPLFAENHLKAVVLDEVHTYGGSQATEIAFLLRKLKHRLGVDEPIQCFATSASLPQSEDADKEVVKFASDMFGEPFTSVIRGQRVRHEQLSAERQDEFSLTAEVWQTIGKALVEALSEMEAADLTWGDFLDGCPNDLELAAVPDDTQLGPALVQAFALNAELRKAAERLDDCGVIRFEPLAEEIFEPVDRALAYTALAAVLRIGMMARSSETEFPLLPARYHIAANSIEGLSLLLDGSSAVSPISKATTIKDGCGTDCHLGHMEVRGKSSGWVSLLTCEHWTKPMTRRRKRGHKICSKHRCLSMQKAVKLRRKDVIPCHCGRWPLERMTIYNSASY
jgi:hypothetical protein